MWDGIPSHTQCRLKVGAHSYTTRPLAAELLLMSQSLRAQKFKLLLGIAVSTLISLGLFCVGVLSAVAHLIALPAPVLWERSLERQPPVPAKDRRPIQTDRKQPLGVGQQPLPPHTTHAEVRLRAPAPTALNVRP